MRAFYVFIFIIAVEECSLLANSPKTSFMVKIKKKLSFANPFPAMKHFFIHVKNQKLAVRNEGQLHFINTMGPEWHRAYAVAPNLIKSDGIKFGTFFEHKTMVYVRAGYENKVFKRQSASLWDTTYLATASSHYLSPGLGLEWANKSFSVSGEYRASISSPSLQKNMWIFDRKQKKIDNALMVRARYQFGKAKHPE